MAAEPRHAFGQELNPPKQVNRAAEAKLNPAERPAKKEVPRPGQGFNGPTPANRMVKWNDA